MDSPGVTVVTLDLVGKDYAGTPALSDVSVGFRERTITAIIGRSGSGKSTLLRMVNGLVVPDTGAITVLGRPIDYGNLTSLRRDIGYAVQGSGLFPHLTVAENITLIARLESWTASRIASRLESLVAMMQLEAGWLGRYPHELSGGQQQRVGLARAMLLDPPLLLLDEPFAALDPLTRMDIHQQLLDLQKLEPRCILLVTHDMREALKLADRILVMESGRALLFETAEALAAGYPDLEPEQLLLKVLEQAS